MRASGRVCARFWVCTINDESDAVANQTATFLLSMAGFGLRNAIRTSVPAHRASWGVAWA